jgi:hypothetical protein
MSPRLGHAFTEYISEWEAISMPGMLRISIKRQGKYLKINLGRWRIQVHAVSREWQELCDEADARNAQTSRTVAPVRRASAPAPTSASMEAPHWPRECTDFATRHALGIPLVRAVDRRKTVAGLGFSCRLGSIRDAFHWLG